MLRFLVTLVAHPIVKELVVALTTAAVESACAPSSKRRKKSKTR